MVYFEPLPFDDLPELDLERITSVSYWHRPEDVRCSRDGRITVVDDDED